MFHQPYPHSCKRVPSGLFEIGLISSEKGCCYEWDSEWAIFKREIREIIIWTNREPGRPLTRIYEEIYLLSPWKAPREEASVELYILILLINISIISEEKLPIYQKSSMAYRVTRHLRPLRQLIRLTAVKSNSQNYTPMTLLTCWTAWL